MKERYQVILNENDSLRDQKGKLNDPEIAHFLKGNLHLHTLYKLTETYPLPSQIEKLELIC